MKTTIIDIIREIFDYLYGMDKSFFLEQTGRPTHLCETTRSTIMPTIQWVRTIHMSMRTITCIGHKVQHSGAHLLARSLFQ